MAAFSDPAEEVAASFKDALQDLVANNKNEIIFLTQMAKEHTEHAQRISEVLVNHVKTVIILPFMMMYISKEYCRRDLSGKYRRSTFWIRLLKMWVRHIQCTSDEICIIPLYLPTNSSMQGVAIKWQVC
jgi:hypothetical protein